MVILSPCIFAYYEYITEKRILQFQNQTLKETMKNKKLNLIAQTKLELSS